MGHRVCGRREAHDRAARSLGASRDRDHHEGEKLSDAQAPGFWLLKAPKIVIEADRNSENDRTGGRRNDDPEVGQGLASPLFAAAEEMMRNENRRGYGNDAPMEIRKRFPQTLGNLAQKARFPHSHSRFSSFQIRRA